MSEMWYYKSMKNIVLSHLKVLTALDSSLQKKRVYSSSIENGKNQQYSHTIDLFNDLLRLNTVAYRAFSKNF